MSTIDTSHQEVDTARAPLPPLDHSAATALAATTQEVAAPGASAKPATARQVAIGKWVHRHAHATDGIGGFLGYQIIRNSLAAIPYGVATAATWMGLEKLAERSSAKFVATQAEKGVAAEAALAQLQKTPTTMMRFARSPIRDVAMIAAGFTLFRGTLKVVRYMKERLFNPNHTEEQTIQEVQNVGSNLKETLKEVAPAEVASTPVAAFALGFGRRFWNPKAYLEPLGKDAAKYSVTGLFGKGFAALQKADPQYTRWQHIKNVFSKPGGYWAEAAIIAASFVPFFELGDRRYKDAQVARGVWLNDPASLVRKSDEQAKMELAASHDLINARDTPSHTPDAVQKSAESLKATGHLRPTDAPTFTCFVMRRVVPTCLGIGAYVAGKRLAYLGLGTMPEHYVANKWLSSLAKMAVVEGLATSLFWINASVVDKYEPWYDKTFKDSKPVPMSDPEIRRRYEELKERLDAKERDRNQGRGSVA